MASAASARVLKNRAAQSHLSRRAPSLESTFPDCMLVVAAYAARIERVSQRVAEQVEAEHSRSDRETGRQRCPRGIAELIQVATVSDHAAPAGGRRLNAESKKRQCSFSHDRASNSESGGDHDRSNHIWKNVSQHYARVSRAERVRSLHIFEISHNQHLTANEARYSSPADNADRDKDDAHRRLQRRRHRDQQEQRWECKRYIGEPHYKFVDPAAVIAREQSECDPKAHRDGLRNDTDSERHACTVNKPSPYVPALHIRAEPVCSRWR